MTRRITNSMETRGTSEDGGYNFDTENVPYEVFEHEDTTFVTLSPENVDTDLTFSLDEIRKMWDDLQYMDK
ncbi:hypothetical protein NVP1084O_010 [Vibrio phage 1.084.O._10N.261.49.F5]|nr:hypothetical protein NVP1084O_010 [Vibrio phage 1.084.O._10N.261.49.F5]